MTPRFLLVCLVCLAVCSAAHAQPTPFDMSPERPAQSEAPKNTATSTGTAPSDEAAGQGDKALRRRYLIASNVLSLSGEIDRRQWAIYLTKEEAATAATLKLGYRSTVLVAPENSDLKVAINNQLLIDEPVSSPDGVTPLSTEVPKSLLKPGFNTITITSNLRHRTDCTVSSTYELWTEIDPAETFLQFDGDRKDLHLKRLQDIRAIGFDRAGQTHIRILVPKGEVVAGTQHILRLAEVLAVATGMPNQSFEVVDGPLPPPEPGALDVAVGTSDSLRSLIPFLEPSDDAAGTAKIAERPDGASFLLLTGESWKTIDRGIDQLANETRQPETTVRTTIANPAVHVPAPPLLRGGGTLSLADLGVPTQQFSGRRFRTEFFIAVPSDFYAEAYGEAVLRLDAGYSGDVEPGSLVNIYVNGNIATTMPIGGGGGSILRHFPLKVTMRHLRPGTNRITLEAILKTAEDDACLPGTISSDKSRFALFGTSEWGTPNFARLAQVPNLAATQGTGFPYGRDNDPVALMLGSVTPRSLANAADVLGRVSVMAGKPLPIEMMWTPAAAASNNAIFIGTPGELPADVLKQLTLDPEATAIWGGDAQAKSKSPSNDLTLEKWRNQHENADSWNNSLNEFLAWAGETFQIDAGGLRLLPPRDTPFKPSAGDTLLVAQGFAPAGDRIWTLFTAPTENELGAGIEQLVQNDVWSGLAGRVTTLDQTDQTASVPAGGTTFFQTEPFSLSNFRLIASNWLSENVLSYALLILVVSLCLGLATTAFVHLLGRRR